MSLLTLVIKGDGFHLMDLLVSAHSLLDCLWRCHRGSSVRPRWQEIEA